jgi:hypothetical protein
MDEVEKFLDDQMKNGYSKDKCTSKRNELILKYSYAITYPLALEEIAKHGQILDMESNKCYWAYCLKQLGVDVISYVELYPNQKMWNTPKVERLETVTWYPDRSLFLCWPKSLIDLKIDFAYECLNNYIGDTVIYVGEDRGKKTSSNEFFDLIEKDWDLSKEIYIPSWEGCNDNLFIYKRKELKLHKCLWCSKETLYGEVCSPYCREMVAFKKNTFETHICDTCGKNFTRRKNSKKAYCSVDCER